MDLDLVNIIDPEIAEVITKEFERQKYTLELIASENIVSPAIMATQGTVLTNKYAEGYPNKRYYGGCEFADIAENLAIERAKRSKKARAVLDEKRKQARKYRIPIHEVSRIYRKGSGVFYENRDSNLQKKTT